MQASAGEIATARLVLVPVDLPTATRLIGGGPGDLAAALGSIGLRAGSGWPHRDSLIGLRYAVDAGGAPGWLATLDREVIGECGTKGAPDAAGRVEIGYGLAAPFRGQGYGGEMVAGLTEALLHRQDVAAVVAEVLADNVPSRRSLESAGYVIDRIDSPYVWYTTQKKV